MARWSVERVPALDGYTIEYAKEASYILSRRHILFSSTNLTLPFAAIGAVDAPLWRRAASYLRPLQRLLRFMFYNVIEAADGSLFVTFDRSLGVVRCGRFQPLAGLVRPSRFLRSACAVASDGRIYVGEYLQNNQRGPMHVYRWVPGANRLEVVHTFPAGSIRHVHGIYFDPYGGYLWCVTGDNGNEARIMRTGDGFRTIETVGGGDETWRCVSLLFTDEGIYYGMDAEFVANAVYCIDRRTLARTRLGEINGPVYYSCARGQDLFFAVTAELCPSQTDTMAALWHLGEDQDLRRLISFGKDRLPVGPFMPGTLSFPTGPGLSDRFWFSGTSLVGADQVTFCVRRTPP